MGPLHQIEIVEWQHGDYVLSTDRDRLDAEHVYHCLSGDSYWAQGINREVVMRSVEHSLVFGLYCQTDQSHSHPSSDEQVGFARVVTDYARFAYLMDVYIEPKHRGHGLGSWLSHAVRAHPALESITKWLLATRDAHGVYTRAGWQPVAAPQRLMEVTGPDPDRQRYPGKHITRIKNETSHHDLSHRS
ncbi:GNAT family N-acetyltransferase [Phytohalomonas tamaricis]|uniref:GNAT family N-acetyltransferase n=1 Tax=Phytohalomonas tamaricis TaxID=2081032 RepID=UPI000D0AF624|nr:GNAT family N-acetyltransferase [Phytohalomonas tamaricis]